MYQKSRKGFFCYNPTPNFPNAHLGDNSLVRDKSFRIQRKLSLQAHIFHPNYSDLTVTNQGGGRVEGGRGVFEGVRTPLTSPSTREFSKYFANCYENEIITPNGPELSLTGFVS